MTWHPDTQQFFFNMIERDLMGDNRYLNYSLHKADLSTAVFSCCHLADQHESISAFRLKYNFLQA